MFFVVKQGPLPPTYFFVALLLTAAFHFALPFGRWIDWPYRLIGVVPILFGSWITIWADQVFKQRSTTVKPFEDASSLVTGGPFGICRHPMYLGMTAILAGAGILFGSIGSLLPALAFAVLMQVRFIPVEEASLERIFGDAYADYRRRVRPWI